MSYRYKDASFLDAVIALRKPRESGGMAGFAPSNTILNSIKVDPLALSGVEDEGDEDVAEVEEEVPRPPPKKFAVRKVRPKEDAAAGSSSNTTTTTIRVKMKQDSPDVISSLIEESGPESEHHHHHQEQNSLQEYMQNDCLENVEIVNAYATESLPPAAPAKDEFAFFSEFLSSQLRILPKAASVELMCKIHVQISEARMKAMTTERK